MSEAKLKKVSANFQISTDSDLYRNIIEPKSSARCLSEFVHDLLDIYNSNSDIRSMIDAKIEEKNPLNQLKEQVLRVNNEHQKTIMSANILSGFVDFNGVDMFGGSNVDMSSDIVNSAEIFESDGVLENLKMLLPSSVQDEIKGNIEKRVRTLESKVEGLINSMAMKGNVSTFNGASKVSQLVSSLENMYDVSDSGVIKEEVSIPSVKEEVRVLEAPKDVIKEEVKPVVTPKVVEPVVKEEKVVGEPVKTVKSSAFGSLMKGIKSS